MVYQPVFRSIMLSLQSTEKSLFGAENLHSTGGVLGEVVETSSMANKPCTDQLSNQGGQVGCNGIHTVTKVLGQLCPVFSNRDDLVAKVMDVLDILLRDFTPHGNLCSDLDGGFEVFG